MEEKTSQVQVEPVVQEKKEKTESSNDLKGLLAQLEAILDEYMVKKAPFALPEGVKEFLVKIWPYLVIISAVVMLPFVFIAFGLSAFFAPLAMMANGLAGEHLFGEGFFGIISLLIYIGAMVMELTVLPGLFKRSKNAWRMIFYASVLVLFSDIFSMQGLFSTIIGTIIGWYLLFQVKDLYKNE
ncbi:MAG: hypothetical protein WCJ51_02325 [Candidatus Moraniibacteriota bacterium]